MFNLFRNNGAHWTATAVADFEFEDRVCNPAEIRMKATNSCTILNYKCYTMLILSTPPFENIRCIVFTDLFQKIKSACEFIDIFSCLLLFIISYQSCI